MADDFSFQSNTPSSFDTVSMLEQGGMSLLESGSPYSQKLMEAGLSFHDKMLLARQANLYKLANIEGYRTGYIVGSDDPEESTDLDSGLLQDAASGGLYRFRMRHAGNFDTVDTADVVAKSRNKMSYQPEYVAAISGKRVEDLTEFDFKNVKNYQTRQTLDKWQDPDYPDLPYNPNFKYETPRINNKIPVLYKSTGTGFYGRDLIDMINPATGRSMTFDAASNPYLNSSFKLSDYLNTERNQQRINEFNALPSQPLKDKATQKRINNLFEQPANNRFSRTFNSKNISMDDIIDKYQADRNDFMEFVDQLGYNVDKAQASLKQTIGHLARAVLPSSWIDEEYWKSLDKPVNEQGMTLADVISGVDPIQYAIHQRHNKENDAVWDKAKVEYEKGNYGMAAVNALNYLRKSIVDVNYLLADSFGQMAASSGGTAVGGTVGGIIGGMVGGPTGAKVGAHIGAFLTGTMITAFDETVMARDQYKEQNNGQDMSPERILATFGAHMVAAAPEQVLQMMGLKKVLPNGISKAIFRGEEKIATRASADIPKLLSAKGAIEVGKQVGKAFLGAGAAEAGQEGFQNFVTAYASQNQQNPKSAWEVATDDEQLKAALAGFAMGGVMHGSATGIGLRKSLKTEKDLAEQQEGFEQERQTLTVGGGAADEEQSKKVINNLSTIDFAASPSSTDTLSVRNDLNKQRENLHLNASAEEALFTKANEAELYAIKQMRKEGKSVEQINKALGDKTAEDVLADKILTSNYNASWAFEHNVKPTKAVKDAATKEILALAKDLGLSEEQAKKTMENVAYDVRRGPAGYENYIDKIRRGSKELNRTDLSEDDKKALLNITGNTAKRLIHLFAYQQNKLEAFAKGFEDIDAGDTDVATVTYPGGGQFKIYGRYIPQSDPTSNSGVFGVVNDISATLDEMSSFLKNEQGTAKSVITAAFNSYRNEKNSLPVDVDLTENLIKRINNAVDRIKDRGTKDFKDIPPVSSKNIRSYLDKTRIVANGVKNNKTETNGYVESYRTLDKLLRRDDNAYDTLKKAIQNNKNYTEQEKIDYIAQLDAINSGIQRNRKNMSNMQADYAATVTEAEEALKTINEDFINSHIFNKGGTLEEYGNANKPLTDARVKLAKYIANLRATASNTDIDKDLSKRLQNTVNLLQKRITENQNTFNERLKQTPEEGTVQEPTRKAEFDREDLISYNPQSLTEKDINTLRSNVTVKGLLENKYASPLDSIASSRAKVKNLLDKRLHDLKNTKPESINEDNRRYVNSLRAKIKILDALTQILNARKESVLTSKIDTTKYRKVLGGMVDTILKAKESDDKASKAPFDIWAHLNNELRKAKDELKTAENSNAEHAEARRATAKLRLDLVEKRIAEVESLSQMMNEIKSNGVTVSRTRRSDYAFTNADLKYAETELNKLANDYRINSVPDFEQNLFHREKITLDGKKVPLDLSTLWYYYKNKSQDFGNDLEKANNKDWFKYHLEYTGELLYKLENPTTRMTDYLNDLVVDKGYSKELVDAMLKSVITDLQNIHNDLFTYAEKAGFKVAKRVQDEVFGKVEEASKPAEKPAETASPKPAQTTPENASGSPETKGNGQDEQSQGEAPQMPSTASQEASEGSQETGSTVGITPEIFVKNVSPKNQEFTLKALQYFSDKNVDTATSTDFVTFVSNYPMPLRKQTAFLNELADTILPFLQNQGYLTFIKKDDEVVDTIYKVNKDKLKDLKGLDVTSWLNKLTISQNEELHSKQNQPFQTSASITSENAPRIDQNAQGVQISTEVQQVPENGAEEPKSGSEEVPWRTDEKPAKPQEEAVAEALQEPAKTAEETISDSDPEPSFDDPIYANMPYKEAQKAYRKDHKDWEERHKLKKPEGMNDIDIAEKYDDNVNKDFDDGRTYGKEDILDGDTPGFKPRESRRSSRGKGKSTTPSPVVNSNKPNYKPKVKPVEEEPTVLDKSYLLYKDENQNKAVSDFLKQNKFLPENTTFNDVINSLTEAQVTAAINLKSNRIKAHKEYEEVYKKDSKIIRAANADILLYLLYKIPDLNLNLPSSEKAYSIVQNTLEHDLPLADRESLKNAVNVYLDTLGDFDTAEQLSEESKKITENEYVGVVSANRVSATLVNHTENEYEAERSGDIGSTPKLNKNGEEIGKRSWLSKQIIVGEGDCYIPKMLAKYRPHMKFLQPFFDKVKLVDEDADIWLNPKHATNIKIGENEIADDETTTLEQKRSRLDNSPHVRLLYNIRNPNGNKGKLSFSYNELTLAVIDFSIKEFIASSQFNKFMHPSDLDDTSVAAMFHLSADALSPLELKKLKHILATQGIPKSILASALGKLIMRNLGLKPNYTTGESTLWEQMAVGLGAYAVDVLTSDLSGLDLFKANEWKNITENGDKAIFALKAKELNLIKPAENAKAFADVLAMKYLGTKTKYGNLYSENGVNRFKNTGNDYSTDPVFKRPASLTPDREVYVRNTQQELKISETQRKVLEKAQQQEWEIDEDIARYIIENRAAIAKREGYIEEFIGEKPNPEFDSLSFEAQLGAQGINNSIRRRLDALQKFFNEQVKRKADGTWEGMFFKCFIGKNGRYYLDSSDFNPQTDKFLRTVCMPAKAKATISTKLEGEQLACENFAIAQAFDHLGEPEKVTAFANKMRSLNTKKLEDIRDVLTKNSDEVFSKWFEDEYKISGVKVENYAQCLNVIQHLMRRNDAIAKGATEFETTLAVENDSTTSGYAIKMLDMPLESVSPFLEKVGILSFVMDDAEAGRIYLSEDEFADLSLTMDELKARNGFVDIYKTTATDVSKQITKLLSDDQELKKLFEARLAKSVFYAVKKQLKKKNPKITDEEVNIAAKPVLEKQTQEMVDLFKGMQAALPNLKNGKVDKYYRNLMKNPTMIFGYSASAKTISQKVAYNLMTDFIDGYLKIMKQGGLEAYIEKNGLEGEAKAKAEAIFNTMQKIKPTSLNSKSGGTLDVQLKKKFADELWVYRGDPADKNSVTLAKLFDTLLGATYGDTAGKVLEDKFKDYLCINNNMIWMSRQMEVWYKTVYDSEIAKLRAKHPKGYVTYAQMKAVREKLFKLGITPYTTLASNNPNTDDAKLFLYNNIKEVDNFTSVQNYTNINGENKNSTTVYADIKIPSSPGRAGAVIPIHGQDGDIVMSAFREFSDTYGMNIIHDAIVMNAFHQIPITKRYTELMFELCAQHDIFDTMRSNFNRVKDAYKTYFTSKEKDENGEPLYAVISNDITENSILNTKILNDKNEYILVSEQNRHIDDSKELFKMVGVEAQGYDDNVITVKDLIDNVNTWGKAITRAREAFYNIPHFGINMGGAPGTGVRYKSINISQHNFKNMYSETFNVKGSNYDGYRTSDELNIIKSIAANNVDARVAILQDLHNLSMATNNNVSSDEHMKHMEEFIRLVNPKYMQDLLVQIADNGDFNAGQYVERKNGSKLIQVALDAKNNIDQVSRLAVRSYMMAPAEIYCHEITHAGTDFTFDHAVELGFGKEYTMAQHIYREISKLVKADDFMPTENFNEALKDQYKEYCQKTWDYMFNNPDHKTNRGFKEFCAFFVSCEKFRNICKQKLTEKYKNEATATRFIDKVIAFVKGIFDVFFGKDKFQNVFKRTYQSAKGLDTIKVQNLFDQMDMLINKMAQANTQATQRLLEHPRRSLENFFSFIGQFIQKYNTPVGQWLKKHTIELADTKGWFKLDPKLMRIGASKWDKAKLYSKVLALYPISARHRKAWRRLMTGVFKVSQDSVFRTVFREMTKPDYQSSLLELLSVKNGMVDAAAKNIESYTRDDLKAHFGRNLKEDEEVSLTNCFLRTDAQCLGDTNYILKALSDDKFADSEAEKIEIKLRNIYRKPNMYNWVCGQCVGLARFMVTEKGNEQLNTNAYNISVGNMFNPENANEVFEYSQEAEQLIDKLTSLYAIQHTRKEFKNIVSTLSRDGIDNYLNTHRNFVEESRYGVRLDDEDFNNTTKIIDPMHVIKGYTKSLIDTTYETELNLVDSATQREMAKQGFKLFYVINPNKVTQKALAIGLYKRFGIPKRRDGGATSLQGYHAIGTTLEEMSFVDIKASEIDYVEKRRKLHDIYRNNADKISEVLRKRLKSSPVTFEDFDRFSEGFSPIVNPFIQGGDTTDYRITMSLDNKRQALGLDERGITVLSKMYASINRKAQSSLANNEIIQFLERDMEENMDIVTRYDKHGNNYKYILLDPLTDDKYLKDAWRVLPPEFREYVKDHDLYVREDWLPMLFGVSNMSLNDTKLIKKIPFGFVKRVIAIAEMVLKTIAYYRKQAIVLKIPAVLIGNIISNLMYSIANHQNPLKVLKRTIANAKAIREYLDTKKELGRIIMKERLGTATANEIASKNMLKASLESNMVHPLMEQGMYQAIVEDLNPEDLESTSKLTKLLKYNKLTDKVPPSIKSFFNQLYIGRGTPIHEFMYTATQYSDFIARATEYQLRMEKAKSEYDRIQKAPVTKENEAFKRMSYKDFLTRYEKVTSIRVLNAFINYDKPQSKFGQYLNDIGVLMFSKFAKRIQHVIADQLWTNPIGAVMFLLSQHFIIDTEDIFEQNLFNKKWSALMNTPWENFVGAAIPMPIQFLTGQQNPF